MRTISNGKAGGKTAFAFFAKSGRRADKELRKKWKITLLAWGILLPSLFFLGMFTVYPIISSFVTSLFKDDLATVVPRFVGLKNYADLFSDSIFIKSFLNNLLVAVCTIPTSIALGVGMAIFTERVTFGRGAVRAAFFYPSILPMVAVANIWLYLYTPIYGLAALINPSWRILGDPKSAIWGLIVMLIWRQAGYLMIFYLSGLQGISREMCEAARIDGADSWYIFRNITWPLLKPTTLYVMIIALTDAYKVVDHLYIMTDGGPNNSTNLLLYYVYQVGFSFLNMGKASAITIVLIVLLLTVTCIYFFRQDKRIFYS